MLHFTIISQFCDFHYTYAYQFLNVLGPAKVLMETGLDLLDYKVCNELGNDLDFDDKREICVGNKKIFPVIDVFIMKRCKCKKTKKG